MNVADAVNVVRLMVKSVYPTNPREDMAGYTESENTKDTLYDVEQALLRKCLIEDEGKCRAFVGLDSEEPNVCLIEYKDFSSMLTAFAMQLHRSKPIITDFQFEEDGRWIEVVHDIVMPTSCLYTGVILFYAGHTHNGIIGHREWFGKEEAKR